MRHGGRAGRAAPAGGAAGARGRTEATAVRAATGGAASARGRTEAIAVRAATGGGGADRRTVLAPVGLPVAAAVEVRPPWPYALPISSMDGLVRRRGTVVERLVHVGAEPVVLRAAQPAPDRVVLAALCAEPLAAAWALDRFRFALAVDDDLRPFHDAFRRDPFIGPAVRRNHRVRVRRRGDPWEVLQSAITEQLIEYERAIEIQRRMIAVLGRRCAHLRDAPGADRIAATAPALLASMDLAPRRAQLLRAVAREVAGGRIDLYDPHHERLWARLRSIPGIGRWTTEMFALHAQGRLDVVPAADVGYLKLVGRLVTGRPKARADEDGVREFFDRYDGWRGLAAEYLRFAARTGALSAGAPGSLPRAPRPGGTPSSSPRSRSPEAA
jgi:3-methyladenine DNA glycosylase/8-oxoguanine DNA glycosylase